MIFEIKKIVISFWKQTIHIDTVYIPIHVSPILYIHTVQFCVSWTWAHYCQIKNASAHQVHFLGHI